MLRQTSHACDQCRFRKLKCDGKLPCARCSKSELNCSFEHKTTRSRRIALLRDRQVQQTRDEELLLMRRTTSPHLQNDNSLSPQHSRSSLSVAGIDDTQAEKVLEHPEDITSAPAASDARWSRSLSSSRPYALDRITSAQSYLSQPTDLNSIQTESFLSEQFTWPAGFSQNDILPWISVYFDRLYLTLPIVDRTTTYQLLILGKHKEDADFASMILAMCALSMTQPVRHEEYESMPARLALATRMLEAAISLRSFDFGEHVRLEGVIAGFFTFAAFFNMGMHKAAWLRLRECVECGKLIGLHQPQTYYGLDPEIKGQRFRLLLILSVTERGYALQRNHSITMTGKAVKDVKEMYLSVGTQVLSTSQNIYIHDDKDIAAVHGLLQLNMLFDAVDEEIIPCWNRSCAPTMQTCQKLTIPTVDKVYHSIAEALSTKVMSPWTDEPRTLNPVQWADCFVLQQWLLTRLWVSCLTHDLLNSNSPRTFMRPSFVLDIAERVGDECQTIGSDALEVHGSGMAERIHDIAMGAIMAAQGYDEVLASPRTQLLLDAYILLLKQFRDEGRPFVTALETAYRTIIG